jgi:hypothetical protein
MIAVAVAMSVIIFMWSQGFLSNTSSATGGQQGSQNQAAQSSISIELATFIAGPSSGSATTGTSCGAADAGTPKMTLVARNVGAVAVTLGSLTMTGLSSNSGFKGSVSVTSVSSTVTTLVAVSSQTSGTWDYSTTGATLNKGASATISVCQTAATATPFNTNILSGDVVNVKLTTSVGTFAQSQFTVP